MLPLGGVIIIASVISTVCLEINLHLFPFGMKLFICRFVGLVSQIFFAWIVGQSVSGKCVAEVFDISRQDPQVFQIRTDIGW